MKRSPLRKRSKNELPTLKRKAWTIFSRWIRNRDENVCYTCGSFAAHAGHFIPQGGHQSVMFDPVNVNAQCVSCNLWRHGNLHEYSVRLIKQHGLDEFNALSERGRQLKKFTKEELLEIIKKYG